VVALPESEGLVPLDLIQLPFLLIFRLGIHLLPAERRSVCLFDRAIYVEIILIPRFTTARRVKLLF
jgi:hypothetical protein